MIKKSLLFICLIFSKQVVFASNCESPQTTIEINQCAELELKKTEAELNKQYQLALKQMDEVGKDASISDKSKLKQNLVDAQRLWVKFRESDCKTVYTLWSDGSIKNVMYLSCMTAKAEQRIKELEQYKKYGDGL